jgi:bifunctional non-homologous end joining protein LigD
MAPPLPMKATSFPVSDGRRPLPSGPAWAFELKWDGMRALAEVHRGQVQLWSSNGRDVTVTFPELGVLGPAFAHLDVVLDGEIVALEGGRPDFGRLQHRMHVVDPKQAGRRAGEVPVALVVFDVLQVGDQSTVTLAWSSRRGLLEKLAEDFPPGVELAHTFDDGNDLLEAARRGGMEGIVAKRRDSLYDPGRRSPSWLKIKARYRQELVVGGWQPGEGNRVGFLGSLLLGYHDPPARPRPHPHMASAPPRPPSREGSDGTPAGPLRYAGKVGTGFSTAELERLRVLLADRTVDQSPFDPPPPLLVARTARWVRPELVAEIEYGSWTLDNVVRHASYLGLRTDKDPGEVGREP